MTDKKKPTITFAPGCFDSFEGTQEELDALMAEIVEMFESGEFEGKAISLDDLEDDEIEDILEHIPEEYNGMPKILH